MIAIGNNIFISPFALRYEQMFTNATLSTRLERRIDQGPQKIFENCASYRLSHTISPSTTATSVVAISRVRRLKRQRSQVTAASVRHISIRNQCGKLDYG